ncbi:MAG: VWA domain-containing protein [Clostridia bacterium]|nr:VWA domain-containing protein [Clostridia bacterium]
MNSIELSFESPLLLLLLIPAILLILLPWLGIPREMRRGFRKIAPLILHGVLALVLVFVAAGFTLSTPVAPDRAGEDEAADTEPEEESGGFLLITDDTAAAEQLREYLPEDAPAGIVTARRAPTDLTILSSYERIVLLGVSAADLPERLAGQLALYVEQGGSLLLSASDHSFSLGGMRGTAYETLLPVSFDYTAEEGDSIALMIVLDCSNSMSGAGGWGWGTAENLSMAKQGAIRSIETLTANDTVGIVSFNSTATLQSPLTPATDTQKATLSRVISALGTSRGTYYCDALELAWEELGQSDAPVRHVIFLSDGEPSDYGYNNIVRNMAADGITVSTIALGYSSSVLSGMASDGGGRYYAVTSVSELPDIMLSETETVLSDPLIEEETAVTLPDGLPTDLPPVDGYLGTTLKETAELLLQTPDGDPILARWTLGEGEADAFASDLARWTDGWRESNTGRRMLRQILAMGISAPVEEAEEISSDAPPAKNLYDMLLPLALVLLLVLLADIAIRRLRWKDIVMFFGRG